MKGCWWLFGCCSRWSMNQARKMLISSLRPQRWYLCTDGWKTPWANELLSSPGRSFKTRGWVTCVTWAVLQAVEPVSSWRLGATSDRSRKVPAKPTHRLHGQTTRCRVRAPGWRQKHLVPSLLFCSASFLHMPWFPHLHKGVMKLPSLYSLLGSLWF